MLTIQLPCLAARIEYTRELSDSRWDQHGPLPSIPWYFDNCRLSTTESIQTEKNINWDAPIWNWDASGRTGACVEIGSTWLSNHLRRGFRTQTRA